METILANLEPRTSVWRSRKAIGEQSFDIEDIPSAELGVRLKDRALLLGSY